jgi:hypothetical protein
MPLALTTTTRSGSMTKRSRTWLYGLRRIFRDICLAGPKKLSQAKPMNNQ